MGREIGKLYQDPIYGAKVLSRLAVHLIDCPEFQRLAGLKQLGFSDFVYRGAVHTRFQHSVGTYFVCRTLLRRIVQNHERLGLVHPGKALSPKLRLVPGNSDLPDSQTTHQSKWRGLVEVVSAAALIHDLTHVPYGHTLEDEFTGIYPRHDNLAAPRMYEMLFNDSSGLSEVFSDVGEVWLPKLSNEELRQLIYVILSWKESIDPAFGFDRVLENARSASKAAAEQLRLENLRSWHSKFLASGLFHPFMSDIVGNTICADLLDYLTRDRQHLGMEPRLHTRLHRYMTIQEGTLYADEGLRISIMVTRKGHGGQRRDVATAVLDIMRERYEMSERVYYHHKKAAAGAMLVRLIEAVGDQKPRDDEEIYPAPWTVSNAVWKKPPHMTYLSDGDLIDYLGKVPLSSPADSNLQRKLYTPLRYRRRDFYQTLLVVDTDLAHSSPHALSYFANELRGPKGASSNQGRRNLEASLANAAGAHDGDVIIYCPSLSMQSKLVDARLEVSEGRVLPLRVQRESFAYKADLDVLQHYYDDLWRAYIFVAPELFRDIAKCKAVVDSFCAHFRILPSLAYSKVRTHDFTLIEGVTVTKAFAAVQSFLVTLPFVQIAPNIAAALLAEASTDNVFLTGLQSGADVKDRLTALLHVAILKLVKDEPKRLRKGQVTTLDAYLNSLIMGSKPVQVAARDGSTQMKDFIDDLLAAILEDKEDKQTKG